MNMLQTKGQMQVQDLEHKQNQVTSLNKSNLSDVEKEKKLREACEGFESIFIQKMWQQMRATLPQENPLVGREEKFWQSMYDQELSKKMASSGGIGLADMMYDQLSQNLVSASRTTAENTSKTKGFEISATPLMPKQDSLMATNSEQGSANPPLIATKTAPAVNDIYEGAVPNTDKAAVNNTTSTNSATNVPNAPNAPIVEQYITNLMAKQAGQTSTLATANPSSPLTGPELARQAQLTAGNKPPLHGVLPAQTTTPISGYALQAQNALTNAGNNAVSGAELLQSQISGQSLQNAQPQIIRTTYTTNLPEAERSAPKKIKQLLTAGQPMVHNPPTPAYAYGQHGITTNKNGQVNSSNVQQPVISTINTDSKS